MSSQVALLQRKQTSEVEPFSTDTVRAFAGRLRGGKATAALAEKAKEKEGK